ncbi:MAG: DNA polymerase III subunit delta, partial [Alphaproteobacteria bacterium]
RSFNLERFDGRAVTWDRLEASLLTPPFFPGKKVLWVENVPYFFSREQKGELGEQVLRLWSEGKKDEASKLLLDLLAVEGWTQEQWDQLESLSSGPFIDLLDLERPDARNEAEALLTYCRSRGMNLSARRGAEDQRLAEWLERGLPDGNFILLTAVQVDRRTRLYKRIEEIGAAFYIGVDRDRSGKVNRETLTEFIIQRLRKDGKTLDSQARELILIRASDDLRRLSQELQKLALYVGDRTSIRAEDVTAIFTDEGAEWIFDLTKAIGDREAVAALAHLGRLIAQGEHPLKLLGMIAGEVRRLFSARQLLENELRGCWRRGMTYAQYQQSVIKQRVPMLTRNPYVDYMCFQRADKFSIGGLRRYMDEIYAAELCLKSSGANPRLVMERLILEMCLQS